MGLGVVKNFWRTVICVQKKFTSKLFRLLPTSVEQVLAVIFLPKLSMRKSKVTHLWYQSS